MISILVSPLPGSGRQDVLNALEGIQRGANVAKNGTGGIPLPDRYITWVHNSEGQLRNLVSSSDVDRLVLTKRCWTILSMPTTTFTGTIINAELNERIEDLKAAHEALEAQIERWSRPGAFVVPDTSFYIEHPDKVRDADFRHILNLRHDPVHVLVPIAVPDELDGLKQSGREHARWRARHTLGVMDEVLRDGLSPALLQDPALLPLSGGVSIPIGDVTIEVVLDPPGHRRLPISDDEIIDRTLAIQSLADRAVTLVTYDTAQSTRARGAGLRAAKLSVPLDPEPQAKS